MYQATRRAFLKTTAAGAGGLLAGAELGFLGNLPAVSGAEAKLNSQVVQLEPEMEPLVRRDSNARAG